MIETTKFYILGDLDIIQGHTSMTDKKMSVWIVWRIYVLIWKKFSKLPQPVGLLNLILNLFTAINIHGKELC